MFAQSNVGKLLTDPIFFISLFLHTDGDENEEDIRGWFIGTYHTGGREKLLRTIWTGKYERAANGGGSLSKGTLAHSWKIFGPGKDLAETILKLGLKVFVLADPIVRADCPAGGDVGGLVLKRGCGS